METLQNPVLVAVVVPIPLGLCGWACCPPPEDVFADLGVGGCSTGSSSFSFAPCFRVRVNSR